MIHIKRKQVAVVGGGYLGAMVALLFSLNKDLQIHLIEKQNKLGGLYNNAWAKDGRFFDFGSRAILQTGVKQLDDLLFSILPDDQYPKTTDNLKEFSFQNGRYCNNSNCLDARTLPPQIFNSGKKQMLAIEESTFELANSSNLEQLCLKTYGQIFTRELIKPAIQKLTGKPLDKLDLNALSIHGLNRIIIADQKESKELKALSSFNDSRIAYARFDDNKSQMIKTYPIQNGLADYCERILMYLHSLENVDVHLETGISNIETNGDSLEKIILDNEKTILADETIWTIPAKLFCDLKQIDNSNIKPPTFRNTVLLHYILETELFTEAHFIYNYDNTYQCYRATFYDNFSQTPDNLKSITVEVFHDSLSPDLDGLKETVLEELIAMGVIEKNVKMKHANAQFHKFSWPNFDLDFFSSQAKLNDQASSYYKNIHFIGKANGKHHSGALVQSADELFNELFG